MPSTPRPQSLVPRILSTLRSARTTSGSVQHPLVAGLTSTIRSGANGSR